MLRTIAKRSLAAGAIAAAGGTAYALYDKRTRRSLSFWSKIGPVVGRYVAVGVSFKYLRSKEREEDYGKWKAERSAAFLALHEENAPKVLDAIVKLRGIFIKAGQYLSVRPEITPLAYRREFKSLQTAAPSESKDVIISVIEKELDADVSELFESIEDKPCGSASTAQAHVAHLKGSGQRVVVKVQYPDAEEMFKSDIVSLSQLARLVRWLDSEASSASGGDLESLLKEFKKQFLSEFDYEAEAKNMREIGDALRARTEFNSTIAVPEVVASHCAKRVITMTYLDGPTLENQASSMLSRAGVDLRAGVSSVVRRRGEGGEEVMSAADERFARQQSLPFLARHALSFLGPDNILRLWGVADRCLRLCQRVAVWCILDAWPSLTGVHWNADSQLRSSVNKARKLLEEGNGGKEKDTLNLDLNGGVGGDREGWVAWALKTRAHLEETAALENVEQWIYTLVDVHGYEVFDIGLCTLGGRAPALLVATKFLVASACSNSSRAPFFPSRTTRYILHRINRDVQSTGTRTLATSLS